MSSNQGCIHLSLLTKEGASGKNLQAWVQYAILTDLGRFAFGAYTGNLEVLKFGLHRGLKQ